jgi:hypothetical protein
LRREIVGVEIAGSGMLSVSVAERTALGDHRGFGGL